MHQFCFLVTNGPAHKIKKPIDQYYINQIHNCVTVKARDELILQRLMPLSSYILMHHNARLPKVNNALLINGETRIRDSL